MRKFTIGKVARWLGLASMLAVMCVTGVTFGQTSNATIDMAMDMSIKVRSTEDIVALGGVMSGEYIAKLYGDKVNRQEFDKYYKFYSLSVLIYPVGSNYGDVFFDEYTTIFKLKNFDTQIAELDKLKLKLEVMYRANPSAQGALMREKLNDYKKNMAKIETEWGNYKNYPVKMKQEAELQQQKIDKVNRMLAERERIQAEYSAGIQRVQEECNEGYEQLAEKEKEYQKYRQEKDMEIRQRDMEIQM
ncbi:MAG: hypothetical protein LBH98_03515 [Chitinispirillales bacterium]|jgi:hypothetical protein|nr:hypothetical protein [Chitinispirillales bacterium]